MRKERMMETAEMDKQEFRIFPPNLPHQDFDDTDSKFHNIPK